MEIKRELNKLSNLEMEKLLEETGSFDKCSCESDKQAVRDLYRNAEAEGLEQIKKHGSAESWYLSGEGRLIDFD